MADSSDLPEYEQMRTLKLFTGEEISYVKLKLLF